MTAEDAHNFCLSIGGKLPEPQSEEELTVFVNFKTDPGMIIIAYGSILQPTTTMRILSFGGFNGCTQGGADAAKWLKSTLN
jgi:hypothetical protein